MKRLFLMLLVSGVILGFTMHYRTDSMYDRGKEDAFRQGYLAGQADAAAGLPMNPHWDDKFDSQYYYDHAVTLFNDVVPYVKGRMVWRGSGYEKGYLGQEPRIWEGGKLIDLTIPCWEP